MPRTYRRRRAYRRPYGRARYRRWWRRPGSYRFNRRIANRGSRSGTAVAIRGTTNVPFSIANGNYYSNMFIINPFVINITPAATRENDVYNIFLANDALFRTYCSLYDQMKIERIGYKFTAIDTVGAGGQLGAVRLVCAWDRCGYFRDLYTGNRPQVNNLVYMAGTRSAMFANNSRVKMYVQLRPSDLQERSSWFDVDPVELTVTAASSGFANNQIFRASPPFAAQGSPGNFFPTLYCALYSPIQNGTGNAIPINIMLDIYCTVSFRNPKYSYEATSSKALPQEVTLNLGKEPDEDAQEMELIHREDTLIDLK